MKRAPLLRGSRITVAEKQGFPRPPSANALDPPSQARAGSRLKTCHRHVFLTAPDLAVRIPAWPLDMKRAPLLGLSNYQWRRSRDSNPGYPCGVYSLSRRAPSASRSLLHRQVAILPDLRNLCQRETKQDSAGIMRGTSHSIPSQGVESTWVQRRTALFALR